MNTINHQRVEVALSRVSGAHFEDFAGAFLAATFGVEYVPLGGVRDGGADGFQGSGIFETHRQPEAYCQISRQVNHKEKIRDTVTRLRKFGREPQTLLYVSALHIRALDLDETSLSKETNTTIRIRDASWIIRNVNHSPGTVAAYRSFLHPYLAFLDQIGGTTLFEDSTHVPAASVSVFLGQEAMRRSSNSKLIESVSDSLILWALEDTDPDQEIFATRDAILQKIETVLPTTKHFIRGVLNHRLKTLSSKNNPTGREIRWYRKDDTFCLPYETRELVSKENLEDEALKTSVFRNLQERARRYDDELPSPLVASVALRAIQHTFEQQGLELAAFLTDREDEHQPPSVADEVAAVIEGQKLEPEIVEPLRHAVLYIIRATFYQSNADERLYFYKLARTYSLLFTLRVEPRIIEYFQSMSSSLVLLVGTDILIRALSERYLPAPDQMTCNLLNILRDIGADLILTEPVAEEVHSHVENTDWEFRNDFREVEPFVDLDIVMHSPKILIRSYFYARLKPLEGMQRPKTWQQYVNQVCDYSKLHSEAGKDQIRRYLLAKFGLRFVSTDELEEELSETEVQRLADRLEEVKVETNRVLAENDAKMVLSVYAKRQRLREEHKSNPYGYRTWWLTHETRVRRATRELVTRKGAHYIMRPEFLVNFVAFSPTTAEIRRSYEAVFPTLLGVKLSNRMPGETFREIMGRAKEVLETDSARQSVMAGDAANYLKAAFEKEYDIALGRSQAHDL